MSINGLPVYSADQALAAYQAIRTASEIDVRLRNKGTERHIVIVVEP